MEPRTWRRTVKFIQALAGPEKNAITFFGGEPLLDPVLFMNYVSEARNLGYEGRLKVITNGTTMSPELMEFMRDNKIDVILSFDGLDQQHFRGNLDKVLGNLPELAKVVSTVNYVVANPTRLLENLIYIWGLGFTVIDDIDLIGPYSFKQETYNLFELQYEKAVLTMVESFLSAGGPRLVLKSVLAETDLLNTPIGTETCGWHRNALGIGVDGRVYPCHRGVELGTSFSVGNVFDGIDWEKLLQLRHQPKGYCVVRYRQDHGNMSECKPEQHYSTARRIKRDVILRHLGKIQPVLANMHPDAVQELPVLSAS